MEDKSKKKDWDKKIILTEREGVWSSKFKVANEAYITTRDMNLIKRTLKVGFNKYVQELRLAKVLNESKNSKKEETGD